MKGAHVVTPERPPGQRQWKLRLLVDRPTITANAQRKMHWAQLRELQNDLKLITLLSAKQAHLPPLRLEKASVELVYYPGNNRKMDADNIAPSLKPIIDCLVGYGVVPDDNSRHIVRASQSIVSRHEDSEYSKEPRLYVVITDESEG